MYPHAAVVRMQALSSVSSIEQLFISAAAAVETALSSGNYTALLMLHDHSSNQVHHVTTLSHTCEMLSLPCLRCCVQVVTTTWLLCTHTPQ
jgi:hypothetical protein